MKFKKTALTLALGASLGAGVTTAADSEHSTSGKVTFITEYEYRGITQTSEKPALQLNLDYSHKSGFYLGAFLTNIKWIKDTKDEVAVINSPLAVSGGGGSAELDLFGGFKFEVVKDLTLDVGYLRYEYPGSSAISVQNRATSSVVVLKKPNTDELYAGLTFGDFGVKYSHATSDLFGTPNSKGSTFVEANWSKQVVDNLTLNAHLGRVQIKNFSDANYTVWRLGGTYDLNGWLLGAYVKGTDAKSAVYTYKGKDWSKDRIVVSVARAF